MTTPPGVGTVMIIMTSNVVLRSIRQARRLAILGLAVRARTSPSTIVAAEKYGHVPRAEVRLRLAAALEVAPTDIWPESDVAV